MSKPAQKSPGAIPGAGQGSGKPATTPARGSAEQAAKKDVAGKSAKTPTTKQAGLTKGHQ
jgi:hypothetical protein